MTKPAAITAAFLDKTLTLLAPLFLAATAGDIEAAREAVRSSLAGYDPRNDAEIRLAALIVAFEFGALDALAQASDPNLSINHVMRMRGNAISLNRAADKSREALETLQKQPPAQPEPTAETQPLDNVCAMAKSQPPTRHCKEAKPATQPPTHLLPSPPAVALQLPASAETPDLVAFVRSISDQIASVPLTRQQRRAAERAAEKAKRQQDYQARRAALQANGRDTRH